MDLGTVLMVVREDCSCLNLSVTLQQLSHGDELVQNKNHFLRSQNQREGGGTTRGERVPPPPFINKGEYA